MDRVLIQCVSLVCRSLSAFLLSVCMVIMVIYIFANSLSLSREVTIRIILDHPNLLIDQTDHHFTASLTKWTNQLIYVLYCAVLCKVSSFMRSAQFLVFLFL